MEVIYEGPTSIVHISEAPDPAQHHGQSTDTPRLFAIKSASSRRELSHAPHDIIKETRMLSGLSHENITRIVDSILDMSAETVHLYMPYIPLKLTKLLASPSFSPWPMPSYGHNGSDAVSHDCFVALSKSIIFQIICGVEYLHSEGIAHRDIKPGNILLTHGGTVKIIDFGTAWKEGEDDEVKKKDIWPESPGEMYCDVGTGPYRAPELMLGLTSYDTKDVDRWALGATIAEFFTSMRLIPDEDEDEEDEDAELQDISLGQKKRPFIVPSNGMAAMNRRAHWCRDSLFDATRGDLWLLKSIFELRGTPTEETWPDFEELSNAKTVTFNYYPPINLQQCLPNLPHHRPTSPMPESQHCDPQDPMVSSSPLDLVHWFLSYPPRRLPVAEARRRSWFANEPSALIPVERTECGRMLEGCLSTREWEGRGMGEWLRLILGEPVD